MGLIEAILAWLGGNITIIILGAIAIIIIAIWRGFAVTSAHIEVFATGDDGRTFRVKAKQPYIGPSHNGPSGSAMLESGAKVVEHLSGNDKYRLPRPEDVIDGVIDFGDKK